MIKVNITLERRNNYSARQFFYLTASNYSNLQIVDTRTSTVESTDSSSESLSAETPVLSPGQKKSKGVSLSNIPKLVDSKRRHMEKTLSQVQRDQLLMNTAKEDLLMKKEMMELFQQSNKTLEKSISKMTMCL